ncbi:hypothetical protein R1sor_024185 [Riccia sorocarpa]|uniref:Uncharacterized protein n=1 Tax=Riccia sorocarpa TaxID=122646 RepID=A0ABD3GVS3_9MARC
MGLAEPERMHSSFARGGSSSRRPVISSSRPSLSTEVVDPARTPATKMGPISLRTSMQRGSPVTSAEPKRTGRDIYGGISGRNPSSSRNSKE